METTSLLTAADSAWREGRAEEARAFYRRVLESEPGEVVALQRLAWLEEEKGNVEIAMALHRRLIARRPNDARAHQDLALCLGKIGLADEALAAMRRATEVDPTYAPAFCNLGLALEDRGDAAGAVAALRRAAQLRPESGFITYHLAAAGGSPPPPLCPADYLVRLFDGYADRFDNHLFSTLCYRGPALLADIVDRRGLPRPWDIMDLGCGTGMTAVPFRADAKSITGVDLSSRMLAHAGRRTTPEGRRVYDTLVQTDVVTALRQKQESFDLIIAADVFIYIGDLRPVFEAAHDALRSGGLMAFTTESFAGSDDFRLNPTRRYAQSPQYIARLAGEMRFDVLERRVGFLRHGDDGRPVHGEIYLLQRPPV